MSAGSSNLIPKMDEPRFKNVVEFVRAQTPDTPGKQTDCVDIALEAKELFGLMQRLNFFCQLPQDPTKTHITCERIPQ